MKYWLVVVVLAASVAAAIPVPAPTTRRPNVILITIDTLRADHVGAYGFTKIATPTLDGMAADGTLYERAISQVPLTWPSHAAILTGTYPFQNAVQDFTGQPLNPKFRTVAQAFRDQGYATGAVVSAFVLDRSWGLSRGFDFYDDAFSAATFQAKDIGLVDRKAGDSVDHALTWLRKNSNHPFFFWLHLYDPHSPYDPPEPYRSQYREHLYDGEIAYADHELGRLISWLRARHLYSRTAIVVLSDHGESLGDHGEKEHGFFVYNSTVHVPLIVKPAEGNKKPQKVGVPVETIAVAPTLLEIAGISDSIQSQFQSKPLSQVDTRGAYSETFYPFSSFGWSPLHAIESEQYHYIQAPNPELYNVIDDPEEKSNLIAQRTAVSSVLRHSLEELLKQQIDNPSQAPATVSPEAAEKLRALGYFAYRSPVSDQALKAGLPDPKDKLWEFNSILRAADAFQVKDYSRGDELLRQVSEKDPNLYIVPFMAGEAALRRQGWDEAASQLQRCLELNPNFDQAMTGLARALANQGKPAEAKTWLEKALKYNPENYRAWYELAYIESKADPAAALDAYRKATAIQANFAPLQRDFGMLEFQQKNYSEAAKHFAKAVELGVNEAPLYNFLGISYSKTSRLNDAVAAFKRAIELDPNLSDAHLNLAYAYQLLGRKQAAGTEYALACRLNEKYCKFIPAAH